MFPFPLFFGLMLNVRERYLTILDFKSVDRTLKWEFGFIAKTIRRWYGEGLPKIRGVPNRLSDGSGAYNEDHYDVSVYFNLDPTGPALPQPITAYSTGDSPGIIYPPFKPVILEDHGEWVLRKTAIGAIVKERKDRLTVPIFIAGPIKNREDWEKFKEERLQPRINERLPRKWVENVKKYRERDYPGIIYIDIWRTITLLMGNVQLFKIAIKDPDFIRMVADGLAETWSKILPRLLQALKPDALILSEDMCYKNGPFISPKLYRELFFNAYKKVISVSKNNGVKIIGLDTDGDCRLLIPFFLEVGIDFLYPFECTGGQNVVEVRRRYPKLAMMGGIDKKALLYGRKAIDKELQSKVPFMLEYGGYIPTIDHNIPPEIPFKNYAY